MTSPEFWIKTEDWHTAGEPFRIVASLPDGHLPSAPSVAQRRLHIVNTPRHPLDVLRQSLCHEPRGHADMYGGFITPPDVDRGHFGVLFWHKDGFSTACGHGTIALGYWALRHGMVEVGDENGIVEVVIDVPSGRVVASMKLEGGQPVHCDFINVAGYQIGKSLRTPISSLGAEIELDLSFAGAVYASVNAQQLGLKVEPSAYQDFIRLGREIKASLGTQAHHGNYDLYGVIFFQEEVQGDNSGDNNVRQRNVTIFADGQLDRSPCGSGTCARVAVLHAEGRLGKGESKLIHDSIVGSSFESQIVSEQGVTDKGFPISVAKVRGRANLVGRMEFFVDTTEQHYPGFLLR